MIVVSRIRLDERVSGVLTVKLIDGIRCCIFFLIKMILVVIVQQLHCYWLLM